MNRGLFGFPLKSLATNFNTFPKKGMFKDSFFGFPYNFPGYIFQCTPVSDNYTFIFTLIGSIGSNIIIDWGDGSTTAINFIGTNQIITHIYSSQISYNINFVGDTTVITKINCPSANLTGKLPSSFPKLFPNLTYFDVSANRLKGQIPDLGQCIYLQTLTLGVVSNGNFFEGTLPDFSNCKDLASFSFPSSTISSELTSFANNDKLTTFNVRNSAFKGQLPPFNNNPLLSFFEAQQTLFTGSPPDFGANTAMQFLSFGGTYTGQAFIGIDNMTALATLSLQSCGFAGVFPTIGNKASLTTLIAPYNSFSILTDFPANKFTNLSFVANSLNRASIDLILSQINIAYSASAPTVNATISLSGGTNASPTGGLSNIDKVSLENIFSNAGKLLTTSINV
jgi:hypothetical protein